MDFLQSAPKSKGGMPFGGATSVVYGKQAKAPQSKTQPQALFLELDEDGEPRFRRTTHSDPGCPVVEFPDSDPRGSTSASGPDGSAARRALARDPV